MPVAPAAETWSKSWRALISRKERSTHLAANKSAERRIGKGGGRTDRYREQADYESRIRDWSSDVCSSDLAPQSRRQRIAKEPIEPRLRPEPRRPWPAGPAVGRTLVDPGGDTHAHRRRCQSRPPQ